MHKRILSLAMALILTLALAPSVFAATGRTERLKDSRVTISNVISVYSENDNKFPQNWHSKEGEIDVYPIWVYECGDAPVTLTFEESRKYPLIIPSDYWWGKGVSTPPTANLTEYTVEEDEDSWPRSTVQGTIILHEPGVYLFSYHEAYGPGYGDNNMAFFVVVGGSDPVSNSPSAWAAEQVNAAIAANLVPESMQSNYTQATTRAEFCSLAVALYEDVKGEITGRSSFDDTNDVNVQKAASIGIVNGVGNNKFDPNAQLTREQAAVMLSNLANTISKPFPQATANFADNNNISSWAADSVGRVQASGIMSGVGNNMFAPRDAYTREQSIITIMRLFDIVK